MKAILCINLMLGLLVDLSMARPHSDTTLTVYLLPGHGSDYRVWQEMDFSGYDTVHLDYPFLPERGERMPEYAQRLLAKIDTTRPFALVGISLGGMLAVEMAQHCNPAAVVILSSARGRFDLPWRYRVQRYLPLQYLLPGALMRQLTIWIQPWFEPQVHTRRELCADMLRQKPAKLFARGVKMIIHWQRQQLDSSVVHLHGTHDSTLPLKAVSPPVIVLPGATHMMTLFEPRTVEAILRPILAEASSGLEP